uniref:Uncharacterized protein n=1 Tax=viral metagenome TaxID=1070528 RepID=A0A6C0KI37_9ZZZZ
MSFQTVYEIPTIPEFAIHKYKLKEEVDFFGVMDAIMSTLGKLDVDIFPQTKTFEIHSIGYVNNRSVEFYFNIYKNENDEKYVVADRGTGCSFAFMDILREVVNGIMGSILPNSPSKYYAKYSRPVANPITPLVPLSVTDEFPVFDETEYSENLINRITGKFLDIAIMSFESMADFTEKPRKNVSSSLVECLVQNLFHENLTIARCAMTSIANLLQFSYISYEARAAFSDAIQKLDISVKTETLKIVRDRDRASVLLLQYEM